MKITSWRNDVRQIAVEFEISPLSVFVAGGRVVSEFCPQYRTKDTDVFFLDVAMPYGKLRKLGAEFVEHPQSDSPSSFDPGWPKHSLGNMGHWLLPARELDLIFLTGGQHCMDVLDSFDLGICQIGWRPITDQWIMTDAAVRDLRDHKITMLRDQPTPRNLERAAQYSDRLGWPMREEGSEE